MRAILAAAVIIMIGQVMQTVMVLHDQTKQMFIPYNFIDEEK